MVSPREAPIRLIPAVDFAVRALALTAFGAALVVLLTHAAVRRGALQPFAWWPRFVRNGTDRFLKPVERRLLGSGGNPQDAPLWLLGLVVVAGLLSISLVRWLTGTILYLSAMRSAGPGAWLRLAVSAGTSLLMAAIAVRVVGSWIGFGRYARWMRPAYLLTDWLIEPIRRRLPAFGMLDLSPIVAYFALWLLRGFLLSALG